MKVEGILVCVCPFLKKAVSFPAEISYLLVEQHPESASPKIIHICLPPLLCPITWGRRNLPRGSCQHTGHVHQQPHTGTYTHLSPYPLGHTTCHFCKQPSLSYRPLGPGSSKVLGCLSFSSVLGQGWDEGRALGETFGWTLLPECLTSFNF